MEGGGRRKKKALGGKRKKRGEYFTISCFGTPLELGRSTGAVDLFRCEELSSHDSCVSLNYLFYFFFHVYKIHTTFGGAGSEGFGFGIDRSKFILT